MATWQAVRAAAGRLEKRGHMAALFARVAGDDLRLAASYLSGDMASAPPGVGYASVQEAFAALGPTAGVPLTLADVDATFTALAATSGPGSNRRRAELLQEMLGRATELEREFLIGLIAGELRQGALRALVLDAIAEARGLDVAALRRAVMHAGSLAEVLSALEHGGAEALGGVQLRPLVPVEPMLAATAGDLAETLAELGGTVAAEWKLDGVRVQVHKDGDEVRVFTRSLRDVTDGSPELVALARSLPAASFILDGEAIARGDGEMPIPFQDLMSDFQEKGRAGGALEACFFDILFENGEPLVDRPDQERRARLEALLPRERLIPRRLATSVAEIEAALSEALAAGHEGLVLKAPDSPYAAGRRGSNWRKVKRARDAGPRRPRRRVGPRPPPWAAVEPAPRRPRSRRRGALLDARQDLQGPHRRDAPRADRGAADDRHRDDAHVVYVRPERVVEIAFDAVQRSSRYDSGMALRFARVKRFRPDKRAADATTVDEIRKLVR